MTNRFIMPTSYDPEIAAKLIEILSLVQEHVPTERIFILAVFGSQNYKIDTPTSDLDTRCILFPDMNSLYFDKIEDIVTKSSGYGEVTLENVPQIFNKLRKSSPNALEIFATPYVLVNEEYYEYYNKIHKSIDEYAQYSKYRLLKALQGWFHKYAFAMSYSCKNLAHMYRLEDMIERILDDELFSKCLVPYQYKDIKVLREKEWQDSYKQEMNSIFYSVSADLENYFEFNEYTSNEDIKIKIDMHQRQLMEFYIMNIAYKKFRGLLE